MQTLAGSKFLHTFSFPSDSKTCVCIKSTLKIAMMHSHSLVPNGTHSNIRRSRLLACQRLSPCIVPSQLFPRRSITAASLESSKEPLLGTLIKSKSGCEYEILSQLGSGSNSKTFIGNCDNQEVAIKRLELSGMNSWKQLELFQREAKVLASLSHPCIPKYIEYIESDGSFYLVQELVKGLNLADMIERGMRASDDQATRIAIELLKTCDYMGNLRPAVVHRDVKPANVVLEGGSWDGRAYLIDFGGVQGLAADQESSSNTLTFVGTFGFLAPEQFRNQAVPASDLYSVGATLLFLLTGRDPSSIPQERMNLKWREVLPTPGRKWSRVLDGLLEPLVEDRMSASDALAILEGREVVKPPLPAPLTAFDRRRKRSKELTRIVDQMSRRGVVAPGSVAKPQDTRVILERMSNRLNICIPAKGLSMDIAFTGAFAIAWNTFVGIWTAGALASGGILFALFSLPFWLAGAQLGKNAVVGALMQEDLSVGPQKFILGQNLALLKDSGISFEDSSKQKVREGRTSELRGAKIVTIVVVNDSPQTAIEILGSTSYQFGEGLDLSEQSWIVSEINSFLEEVRGHSLEYESFPVNQVQGGEYLGGESFSSSALIPLMYMDSPQSEETDDGSRGDGEGEGGGTGGGGGDGGEGGGADD